MCHGERVESTHIRGRVSSFDALRMTRFGTIYLRYTKSPLSQMREVDGFMASS